MARLSEMFLRLRERNEKALILFVTAGDPDLSHLPDILRTLAENGADAIEIGLPFSDPIADGPTIQASSQRALDRGVTLERIFSAIGAAQVDVPLVAMGYYNTVLRRGLDGFADAAHAAGISGAIVSDLTPEEAAPWSQAAQRAGIDTIFLAAPTSTDDRLERVSENSTGFIYAVSRTGVTGSSEGAVDEVSSLVSRIRKFAEAPVCVGFGIRTPEDVRRVCMDADGAVIGSSLVELLAGGWDNAVRDQVARQVRAWKAATVASP